MTLISTLTSDFDSEDKADYIVYRGLTVTSRIARPVPSVLPVTSPNFDPYAPSVEYDAGLDLALNKGESVCFRLRAYNDVGVSGPSGAACARI